MVTYVNNRMDKIISNIDIIEQICIKKAPFRRFFYLTKNYSLEPKGCNTGRDTSALASSADTNAR